MNYLLLTMSLEVSYFPKAKFGTAFGTDFINLKSH